MKTSPHRSRFAGGASPDRARAQPRPPRGRRRRRVLVVSTLIATLAQPTSRGPANAATLIGSASAAGIVPATCLIAVATAPFGPYVGKVAATTATFTVTCTVTTAYSIALNAGLAEGATVGKRWMSNPGGRIAYSLCSDPAFTLNWGQTTGVDTVGGIGIGGPQVLTVYARIPAGQYPAPGTYTDTVVATVSY